MVRWSRRELLGRAGAAGVAGVAGCVGRTVESSSATNPGGTPSDPPELSLSARLDPEEPRWRGAFGASVAVGDGVVVVGEPVTPSMESPPGRVHLFEHREGQWRGEQVITSPEGTSRFGVDVDVADGRILVGDFDHERNRPVGHVYEREGGSWVRRDSFAPTETPEWDNLGHFTFELAGDAAFVGVTEATTFEVLLPIVSRVYEFVGRGGEWRRTATLNPPGDSMLFGASLTHRDGTVVVSGREEAFEFERSTDGWRHAGTLTAGTDLEDRQFGYPVEFAGETLLVGAVGEDGEDGGGSLFPFERSGDQWRRRGRLSLARERYSHAIAASDRLAVVGSTPMLAGPNHHTGTVETYVRSDGTWRHRGRLPAGEVGGRNYWLGESVALSNSWAIAGAPYYGDQQGAALVYALAR